MLAHCKIVDVSVCAGQAAARKAQPLWQQLGFQAKIYERKKSRNWQGENGRKKKSMKKNNRYKTGGYSTVIFGPYTPGGELAKKLREIEASGTK